MPNLTDDEINAIAKQMADTLTQQRRLQWVDPETHYQHHEWVEQRRQEDERRQTGWQRSSCRRAGRHRGGGQGLGWHY